MNQDLEHLRLLSMFHYVLAVLAGLFSLFPVLYFGMGLAMVSGRFPDAHGDETARFMGWFFVAFGAVWMVCSLAFAVCLWLSGRFLAQHRRYLFCHLLAALACRCAPFGPRLGVFTILVLVRASVKGLFGEAPASLANSSSA